MYKKVEMNGASKFVTFMLEEDKYALSVLGSVEHSGLFVYEKNTDETRFVCMPVRTAPRTYVFDVSQEKQEIINRFMNKVQGYEWKAADDECFIVYEDDEYIFYMGTNPLLV